MDLRLPLVVLLMGPLACIPTPEQTTGDTSAGASASATSGAGTDSGTSTSAGSGEVTSATESTGDSATSTSTSTSTSGSTTEDESTTCNFICDDTCGSDAALEIDGVIRCTPRDPCDVWAQDCPDGEKCSAWGSSGGPWDAVKCVPVEGEALPGEPCVAIDGLFSGRDTCVAGAMCFGVDPDTLEGECVDLCDGSPDAPICAADAHCVVANDGALNLCLPSCHPLDKTCPEGQACMFVDEGFICSTSAGAGVGEACTISTCADGLTCAPGPYVPGCDESSCCAAFCDVDLPDACADYPETACVSFYDGDPPPELENVGVCVFAP